MEGIIAFCSSECIKQGILPGGEDIDSMIMIDCEWGGAQFTPLVPREQSDSDTLSQDS